MTRVRPIAAVAAALVVAGPAVACDGGLAPSGPPVTLEGCGEIGPDCRTAEALLALYARDDDGRPEVLTVGLQASPWRLYDGAWRIVSVDRLAGLIRGALTPEIRGVQLRASWTGVVPPGAERSLADQVSAALDGFPVSGAAGFLWQGPNDAHHITGQAATTVRGAVHTARPGEAVMSSAAAFVAPEAEDRIPEAARAAFLLRRGVSEDVLGLCPSDALAQFRRAAEAGSPVAAYNAAVMLLETGERAAALTLLDRAAAGGDAPSRTLAAGLRAE